MIRFIVTPGHAYTVGALVKQKFGVPVPACAVTTYPEMFAAAEVQPGTYVLSDLERLSDLDLVLAADLHRALAEAGCRVLNDPARVRSRYALLRSLREAGINDFDAYRADGHPRPARFPVFVRAEAEHKPALTGLLPDQAALDAALAELQAQGRPLRGLVVIEYCAQPVAPGLFRRYGAFRVGGRMHLDHVVTEDSWNVKWGRLGLATEAMYEADDREVRDNRYADVLERAFDAAGIDYGRADFGLVDGRPQIYEINTNPAIGGISDHPSATRRATLHFAHERFAECLFALDAPEGAAPVPLGGSEALQRRRAEASRPDPVAAARIEAATARLRAKAESLSGDLARVRAARASLAEQLEQARARLAALDAEAAARKAQVARLRTELAAAQARLATLLASTSWRLTAPLRAGGRALRRLRRGPR